jgi:hypothetical protein
MKKEQANTKTDRWAYVYATVSDYLKKHSEPPKIVIVGVDRPTAVKQNRNKSPVKIESNRKT